MSEEGIVLIILLFCMCGTAVALVWLVCKSDDKAIALLKDIIKDLEIEYGLENKPIDINFENFVKYGNRRSK
jgi:hypothetical protein